MGTDKPYYSTNDLRTEILPSLAPTANAPTLAWVEDQFKRVQMNHKGGPAGAMLRPQLNFASTYQPYNGVRNDNGALRLMLNDPLQDKMFALIVYVQYGIDLYHFILGGQTWPGGYGVEPGHKLPLAFAAVLLNIQAMKDTLGSKKFFDENTFITFTQQDVAVWGGVNAFSVEQEYNYWNYIIDPPSYNTENARDPYGYIDNSMTALIFSEGYQLCCLSQPFKGEALASYLIPELKTIWNLNH